MPVRDSLREHVRLTAVRAAALTALAALALAAPASASVLWTADAERPASAEWASSAAPGAACAVTGPNVSTGDLQTVPAPAPVSGPAASHPNAYHFALHDGEECYGERSELGQANPESPRLGDRKFYPGQEVWVAFEVYIPSDYQLEDPNGYSTGILQFKQIGGHGVPAMQLRNGGGHLCFYIDSLLGGPETRNCDSGAIELGAPSKNTWIKLLFHMYLSGDEPGESPGWVEILGDLQDGNGYGVLMPRVYARTSKLDEETAGEPPLPTQARIGIYRNPLVNGTEDLYVDGFVAATDRASAEAVAFEGANIEASPLASPASLASPEDAAGEGGSGAAGKGSRQAPPAQAPAVRESVRALTRHASRVAHGKHRRARHARSHKSKDWLRLSSRRRALAARRHPKAHSPAGASGG